MTVPFLPGIELARRFYHDEVRPLLDRHVPGLVHSAALIGPGSEVLGFDSARSTDHNWGPRCQIFLADLPKADPPKADPPKADLPKAGLKAALAAELPETFLGWRLRFPDVTTPNWPVSHWVEITTLNAWFTSHLGFDPRQPITLEDWLATPTQLFAEQTAGAVFHDDLGLTDARSAIAWYPDDVWCYVLACQWQRIEQEDAFPGRCAESGDDLGSVIITARLVRDAVRLALLMRRRYPPYSKWLGTAFKALPGVDALRHNLTSALAATTWPEREQSLIAAFEELARWHNELGLTESIDPVATPFWDRPYRVIQAGRFTTALRKASGPGPLSRLPLTGAIDQFADSTDAVGSPALRRAAIGAATAAPLARPEEPAP